MTAPRSSRRPYGPFLWVIWGGKPCLREKLPKKLVAIIGHASARSLTARTRITGCTTKCGVTRWNRHCSAGATGAPFSTRARTDPHRGLSATTTTGVFRRRWRVRWPYFSWANPAAARWSLRHDSPRCPASATTTWRRSTFSWPKNTVTLTSSPPASVAWADRF